MTRLTEKATAITPSRELQPDEYFNETDHLIYCSKCNTPRQCRHELQGKVLIPSIRCKCQQEIFEQEEAQRKLHEKQMEIEHLKTSGLQDKALYDYTFARDNGINPEIKLAHNYVSNWEEINQTLPDFSSGVMSVLENLFLQAALPMPFWKKAFLY